MAFDIVNSTLDLYKSRLLRNDSEIEQFENAMEAIFEQNKAEYISNLCVGFHDESKEYEITYGVLHAIEYFYSRDVNQYFTQIFQILANNTLVPQAIEWREKIVKRIINKEKARNEFIESLRLSSRDVQTQVKEILLDLSKRNPEQFQENTSLVLDSI